MNNVLQFYIQMKDLMSVGLAKLARQADTSLGQVQAELDQTVRANQKLANSFDHVERKGRSTFGKLGDFVKGNLIANGIQQLGGMVTSAFEEVYNTSLKNSGLTTAINATTGGQGLAAVRATADIANKYGLNYEASLEGVKVLTGGLKGMNLTLSEQMKIFEGVSTGVGAMKLSSDDAKGAMLALGQMASKGIVSAEELRGQLGERIPGAFGLAAQAMNVTESELGKMLERGEIASRDFLPKFAAQMQKTFGEGALAAATGPQAIQNRFENAIFNIKTTLGDGLIPLITPLLEKFTKLAVEVLPWIESGLNSITGIFSGVLTSTDTWGYYIDWAKNLFWTVWDVVSHIGENYGSIIKDMIEWVSKSQILKDVFWAVGEFAGLIGDVVKKTSDLLLWVWNNVTKPFLDKLEWAYGMAKDLLGLGGTGKELTVAAQSTLLVMPPDIARPGGNTTLNPGNGGNGGSGKMLGSGPGSEVAKGITSGGPRVINNHIGKMVEKIEIRVYGGVQEGLDQLEQRIEEVFLRILNSGAALQ